LKVEPLIISILFIPVKLLLFILVLSPTIVLLVLSFLLDRLSLS